MVRSRPLVVASGEQGSGGQVMVPPLVSSPKKIVKLSRLLPLKMLGRA